MSSIVAKRLQAISVPASAAMTQKARELKAQGLPIISLSSGEPDFPSPPHVIEAAHQAALAGDTKYPPLDGTNELRAAIAAKFKRDNRLDYAPSQITVAGGAKQIIFNAILASCDAGDEVLIPAPSWVSYADIVRLAGGTPILVEVDAKSGFTLQPELLEKAITPRTKWLLLNFPNNPTGAVCERAKMQELAQMLLRHPDVWILSDDIYEHLIYDDFEFCTLAEVEPKLYERTLTVNGISKAYAMTGWRIGFCGGPKILIEAMGKINAQNSGGIATVAQAAAVAALNGDQSLLKERAAIYSKRRDFVVAAMNEAAGISCHTPKGAFYVYPHIGALIGKRTKAGRLISNDSDFVLALLEEAHVATVAGEAYGLSPYFRISYATSMDNLIEACARIQSFCASLV